MRDERRSTNQRKTRIAYDGDDAVWHLPKCPIAFGCTVARVLRFVFEVFHLCDDVGALVFWATTHCFVGGAWVFEAQFLQLVASSVFRPGQFLLLRDCELLGYRWLGWKSRDSGNGFGIQTWTRREVRYALPPPSIQNHPSAPLPRSVSIQGIVPNLTSHHSTSVTTVIRSVVIHAAVNATVLMMSQ